MTETKCKLVGYKLSDRILNKATLLLQIKDVLTDVLNVVHFE